jgi:hypothetical protein
MRKRAQWNMQEETVLTSEPRWPGVLALLSIGYLHYALPREHRVGPGWLVLMLVEARHFRLRSFTVEETGN